MNAAILQNSETQISGKKIESSSMPDSNVAQDLAENAAKLTANCPVSMADNHLQPETPLITKDI